ncbi:MAG: hypothetical protein A2161_01745 [Candidatus Schekmanbacteria bacterium RBG_13_48_7]|uniref:Uncharacterized protein n=1 Tax=Candidatus Schekmanbacteria bacterium RBG_13_48_7 TaxID=1817878 RepID=A0A1F7RNN0_9BACT|nr:MAG: hypothetical protein A2161_01745 [Candidatus Schekmanbacteria bacterium RBG_13_48_7]
MILKNNIYITYIFILPILILITTLCFSTPMHGDSRFSLYNPDKVDTNAVTTGDDDHKLRIAIADFESVSVPVELGKSAAALLRSELIGSPDFDVIERDRLEEIIKEHKLTISGLVSASSEHIKIISLSIWIALVMAAFFIHISHAEKK